MDFKISVLSMFVFKNIIYDIWNCTDFFLYRLEIYFTKIIQAQQRYYERKGVKINCNE